MPEIITLHDATTGATAKIAPQRGFNCFSYKPVVDGEAVEVLWTADDFVAGGGKGSHSGIPILFPFPGRLRGTSFSFQGGPLAEAGDGIGNAIHGFVIDRPWRLVEQTSTLAVGEFQASIDGPEILAHWPTDFRIAVAYELVGHADERGEPIREYRHQWRCRSGSGRTPIFACRWGAGDGRSLPGDGAGGKLLGAGKDAAHG